MFRIQCTNKTNKIKTILAYVLLNYHKFIFLSKLFKNKIKLLTKTKLTARNDTERQVQCQNQMILSMHKHVIN